MQVRQAIDVLRRPWVQRGIRAAVAAGLAWQVAVLLPPTLADYASAEAIKFLETLSNILVGAIENRRLGRQRVAAASAEETPG